MDKEVLVQEAACTSFTIMVMTKKERLEPYLFDIIKIITRIFDIYTNSSLLTIYDIISLLTENYEDHFKNPNLINDLVKCIMKKWYIMLKTDDYKNISPIFDMVCSIIRVSSHMMIEFVNDFINNSLKLIEINLNNYIKDPSLLDKEIISKCLDLISTLCQSLPDIIKAHPKKYKIVELAFKILDTENRYIKHYVIALFGDLIEVDPSIISPYYDRLISILLSNIDLSTNMDMERLSVCNNSCWTIGILAIKLSKETFKYVSHIMNFMINILAFPKVINT
jgi:transportin-1